MDGRRKIILGPDCRETYEDTRLRARVGSADPRPPRWLPWTDRPPSTLRRDQPDHLHFLSAGHRATVTRAYAFMKILHRLRLVHRRHRRSRWRRGLEACPAAPGRSRSTQKPRRQAQRPSSATAHRSYRHAEPRQEKRPARAPTSQRGRDRRPHLPAGSASPSSGNHQHAGWPRVIKVSRGLVRRDAPRVAWMVLHDIKIRLPKHRFSGAARACRTRIRGRLPTIVLPTSADADAARPNGRDGKRISRFTVGADRLRSRVRAATVKAVACGEDAAGAVINVASPEAPNRRLPLRGRHDPCVPPRACRVEAMAVAECGRTTILRRLRRW